VVEYIVAYVFINPDVCFNIYSVCGGRHWVHCWESKDESSLISALTEFLAQWRRAQRSHSVGHIEAMHRAHCWKTQRHSDVSLCVQSRVP
jgi:hypothetical protein